MNSDLKLIQFQKMGNFSIRIRQIRVLWNTLSRVNKQDTKHYRFKTAEIIAHDKNLRQEHYYDKVMHDKQIK